MKAIYVDDKNIAIDLFRAFAEKIEGIQQLNTFPTASQALKFVSENKIDIAFLDINLPDMSGLALSERLCAADPDIKIVFVSGYDEYALEAFKVNAVSYLLKPYTLEDVQNAISRAKRIMPTPVKKVFIRTMPNFDVYIDGVLLPFKSKKPKELLALLVDRRGGAIDSGFAISYLWEERPNDENTKSLYRMTAKRLRQILSEAGVRFILSEAAPYSIKPDTFTCDYYQFLDRKLDIKAVYHGEYMSEYSWAESTNALLYQLSQL